ncbi:MAG: DegT/DnrJ/EryC1/StrS family aminotransferase [bacterium]|nr:DegT/DnrJ/EryC1/StrS family aminotransferase [bacterium]
MATYVLSPELTRSLAKKPTGKLKNLLQAATRFEHRVWVSALSLAEAARRGTVTTMLPEIVGIDPVTHAEWGEATGTDAIWQATVVTATRMKADAIIVKSAEKEVPTSSAFRTVTLEEALAAPLPEGAPMLDFKAQLPSIYAPIFKSLNDTFANTAYVCGAKVKAFETKFAAACHAKYCYAVSSGTDALHLALLAVGIQPGDEVITTPFTFFATVEAIILSGAKVVFADIDPKTYTIDPAALKRVITPRTKAIIPIHLYGQAADMQAIMAIAEKAGIPVIEDCAQAHLATDRGKVVGGIGNIGAFSFYPTKNLGAWGEGGAVTTNNPEIANRLEWMRNHGQREKYKHDLVGHNYRMEEVQGAVLNEKVNHLEHWTELREAAAKRYMKGLKNVGDVVLPFVKRGNRHVWHLFTIRTKYREELSAFLAQKKIGFAIHYPIPLHLQPAWQEYGIGEGSFPESEKAGKEVVSLPMYSEILPEQQDHVIAAIREFFANK